MNEDLGFTPDSDEYEAPGEVIEVEFKPAKNAAQFKEKADRLMSDAMDLLNTKIRSGFAEASDIKSALEFGKYFKSGIETVDEAAEKAMREAEEYAGLEDDETLDDADGMRFEG